MLNKLYSNTDIVSHVAAVSYQGGRSCPLPGVPVLIAFSQEFYVPPKGQAVNQNVSWLEKTELML